MLSPLSASLLGICGRAGPPKLALVLVLIPTYFTLADAKLFLRPNPPEPDLGAPGGRRRSPSGSDRRLCIYPYLLAGQAGGPDEDDVPHPQLRCRAVRLRADESDLT